MLHLLVDTSTWLDLGKRRDGQRLIRVLDELVHDDELILVVPPLINDEFARNRPKVEASITTSLSDRLKASRREVQDFGGDDHPDARHAIDELAHNVPLIGAMTARNFTDVEKLFAAGSSHEPTDEERRRAVQRALDRKAPFHRSKNSVADALLMPRLVSRPVGMKTRTAKTVRGSTPSPCLARCDAQPGCPTW
ncbi:PIN domain-containing protein [Millisia brevis]|uniref:PIN domain-containing protein n=1 Tax=Millisia brevis TaxID=264148 RepID=UPI0012EDA3FE|nr:PIN domain-containing protein [Millisia brevis]